MNGQTRKARAKRSQQAEVYDVLRQDQLEAVVSTRRHDIVDQVSASGPMSVKELASAIGVAPSSLYYHIEHLCAVGLLLEAGERLSGTKLEQLYTTPGRQMRLFRALQEPRNKRVMKEIVDALSKQASRDFAKGFATTHRETAGRRRNMRFFRLVGRPGAATLELINAHLDAITELMVGCAHQKGPRMSLMWVAAPLEGKDVEGD